MTNGDLRETRKQFFSGIRGRFSDPLNFMLKRRWMTPYGTPVSRESCRKSTEGMTQEKRCFDWDLPEKCRFVCLEIALFGKK